MKQKLRLTMSMLLLAVCGVTWGQETIATFNHDNTDDWTINGKPNYSNSGGYQLISSEMSIISPEIDWSKYTDITITIKARKYGGPNATQGKISVTQGSTELTSYSPSSTTLTNSDALEITPTEGALTISCPGASSSRGCGISEITIKGTKKSSAVATTTTITSGITNMDVYTSTEAGSLSATVTAGEETISNTVTWTSSNEGVATIDQEGTVTLVAAGTTTITALYAGVENEYQASSATYELTVTNSSMTKADWVASEQGYGNGGLVESDKIDDNITVTFNKGNSSNAPAYYTTGTAVRIYGGGYFTIAGGEGVKLTNITLTFSSGEGSNSITTDVGTYENGTWAGNSQSVTFTIGGTSGHRRIAKISVSYTVESSSAVATTITIDDSGIDTNDLFLDTTAGSLSAIVKAGENVIEGATVTWSSSDENVATVDANGAVTLVAAGTTTITASYAGVEEEYRASEATYELTVTNSDPNLPGAANNPYTVEQAIQAINSGTGTTGVYVKGIVSTIVTPYDSQYGNISYKISSNGSLNIGQILAYRGKSYNGDNFTSEDGIQIGDEVIIFGNLTKYGEEYEFAQDNQLVSLLRKNKATATINKTALALSDGENSAEITITPSGISVSYTSSNEAVATVSETGIVTAVSVGTAIITASWIAQTIEGAAYEAGSETFNVTVTAPIQCVYEENYYTRFDFTQNGWGLPEGNTNKMVEENNFMNTGKTIKLAGSKGNGYYFNKQGYLMLGQKGAYLELPAFDFDVAAIEVVGNDIASGKVNQNIYVDETAVSTETTGAKDTNIYFIDKNYQAAGNTYTIKVTNDYNSQITEIKVYKKDAFVEFAVTDAGYRTYCDTEGLDFSVATKGLTAYIIEGVDAEGSTNLVTKEVTNVPAKTGLLIQAEAGTYYVAKSKATATVEPTAEAPVIITDDVKNNQLTGVVKDTEIEHSIIVLMKGQEGVGFYKTSKTFTVGANTAYLPVSVLETVATTSADSGVKTFSIFGTDDNTPTGINGIAADELTGKDTVIYNLHGQRVSRAEKGIYIVNGKKVLVK